MTTQEKIKNYLQTSKEEQAKKARKEMLATIETLKTVVTFIDTANGHDTEQYVKMINCLNRFIKDRLIYTSTVLKKEDEKQQELFHHNSLSDALQLTALLTKETVNIV